MIQSCVMTRRVFLAGLAATPTALRAAQVREIGWEDLIPPGVPYSEIIAEGEMDEVKDTWKPVFDANGTRLNDALAGQRIKLPGYIVPLETTSAGVLSFILVPYMGACIHVPPPPPNQLVFVTTPDPWPMEAMWDAIWVTGVLSATMRSTEIAEIGYELRADKIELYQWL